MCDPTVATPKLLHIQSWPLDWIGNFLILVIVNDSQKKKYRHLKPMKWSCNSQFIRGQNDNPQSTC